MLRIGSERQCVFAPDIIDTERTTARFKVHRPERREPAIIHDAPWEGVYAHWHNMFFDDEYPGFDGSHPEGVYRIYYLTGSNNLEPNPWRRICYAESADGIHWVKPELGGTEVNGSKKNNVLNGTDMNPALASSSDGFMVFRDDNPACPPERRYKAVSAAGNPIRLQSYYSPDGLHFSEGPVVTRKGYFDSLNTAFWDPRIKRYRCYFRSFHDPIAEEEKLDHVQIREIRYTESEDFEHWTEPVPLSFMGGEDYQLYSNVISPYFRAPQLLLGFPTRYVRRGKWTENYDELCGKELRQKKMLRGSFAGLVLTDCVFMVSRDGVDFLRYDSAFMRPGPENGINWSYGDCYPTRGMALTKSAVPGAPDEISMYAHMGDRSGEPPILWRYTLRQDGFVSLHADGEREETVYTQDIVYEGQNLYANFSTSAHGYLYFLLANENNVYESAEIFGDAVDRKISFTPGTVSAIAGGRVRLIIRMRDADLYSFRFGE